jgi:hypothetical protein
VKAAEARRMPLPLLLLCEGLKHLGDADDVATQLGLM